MDSSGQTATLTNILDTVLGDIETSFSDLSVADGKLKGVLPSVIPLMAGTPIEMPMTIEDDRIYLRYEKTIASETVTIALYKPLPAVAVPEQPEYVAGAYRRCPAKEMGPALDLMTVDLEPTVESGVFTALTDKLLLRQSLVGEANKYLRANDGTVQLVDVDIGEVSLTAAALVTEDPTEAPTEEPSKKPTVPPGQECLAEVANCATCRRHPIAFKGDLVAVCKTCEDGYYRAQYRIENMERAEKFKPAGTKCLPCAKDQSDCDALGRTDKEHFVFMPGGCNHQATGAKRMGCEYTCKNCASVIEVAMNMSGGSRQEIRQQTRKLAAQVRESLQVPVFVPVKVIYSDGQVYTTRRRLAQVVENFTISIGPMTEERKVAAEKVLQDSEMSIVELATKDDPELKELQVLTYSSNFDQNYQAQSSSMKLAAEKANEPPPACDGTCVAFIVIACILCIGVAALTVWKCRERNNARWKGKKVADVEESETSIDRHVQMDTLGGFNTQGLDSPPGPGVPCEPGSEASGHSALVLDEAPEESRKEGQLPETRLGEGTTATAGGRDL